MDVVKQSDVDKLYCKLKEYQGNILSETPTLPSKVEFTDIIQKVFGIWDDTQELVYNPDTEKENNNEDKFKRMLVSKDGDHWCFTLPDFKDLQNSPASFQRESVYDLDEVYQDLLDQSKGE